MSGNVSRRGTGGWEYRFDIAPDALTGKRRRFTKSGFATKREATQAMNKAVAAHDQGRSVKPSRRTVESYVNEWHLAIKGALRPSTWVNYRNYLDAYVIPVIGQTALQDLTAVRLNLLYTHLLERGRVKRPGGLSPKTVQNVHRMLHRALRDAVKWDQLPRNFAEDAEPPRASRPRPTVWTPEQLGAFVRHVREDRFYALWLLVATTGLRRGELAGLQRGDIDFRTRTVSPRTPRVVVAGHAVESEAKTPSGIRNLALDPDTLGLSVAMSERGSGSAKLSARTRPCSSSGRPDDRCTPTRSPGSSTTTAVLPACRGSVCTTSGTLTPAPR